MRPIPDRLTPLECWPVHMTRRQDNVMQVGGEVAQWLELRASAAWRPRGPGFESCWLHFALQLKNGNSVYPTLPVSFGGDTKNRCLVSSIWCLCQGKYKIPHRGSMRNLSWNPQLCEKNTPLFGVYLPKTWLKYCLPLMQQVAFQSIRCHQI